MKPKELLSSALVACALLAGTVEGRAQASFTVDPGASWVGYLNVFALPAAGTYPSNLGAYQFGSGWGVADLMATWSGPVLKLAPNSIGDPSDYWYTPAGGPGALGNKIMDANLYVELAAGSVNGQTVTFSGLVLSDSLTLANNPANVDGRGHGWTSVAFIKDFAPDYSSFNSVTVPISPGPFSINLLAVNDPARHVQYGFETLGPDVWITDNAAHGYVQVTGIPEASTVLMAGIAAAMLLVFRRRS